MSPTQNHRARDKLGQTNNRKTSQKKQTEITRVELRASGAQGERPGWIAVGIEK